MLNCLIIDDEQLAREMLNIYVQRMPKLNSLALCSSALEASNYLKKQQVDLLFLDIQMPQQTGIEFLSQLPSPPMVIFTTAYPNYALKGFELNVVDYLLKPISFERFEQATQKAIEQSTLQEKAAKFDEQEEHKEQFLMVHAEHKHYKILLDDIIYIESLKEYVRYYTKETKIIELNALKQLEKDLPEADFIRIHRSYIAAVQQIKGYEKGQLILNDGTKLPIGKTYKKQVLAQLFG